MNLAIDLGNTRLKAGIFAGNDLRNVYVNQTGDQLKDLISEWGVDQAIICRVGAGFIEFSEILHATIPVMELTPSLEVPINNLYQSPATLGMDRLAAVVGAYSLYPGTPNLVVDAGTSITYDLIDQQGNYRGGGISPGIGLRFKALKDHTSKLPLIAAKFEKVPLIGTDTHASISSGVINGTLAEMEGIIGRYADKFANLKVLLCGGDASFFESMLKAPIFVVPHLVLIGLNSILMHHAKGN